MIKTYKDLVSSVSFKNSVSQQDTLNVVEFFFKDLKKKLETMEGIEIYVYGLGSFEARRKKIYDLIYYFEAKKENIQKRPVKESTRERLIVDCDNKIIRLKELHELYRKLDKEKKDFKNEQRQTTGGIQEQEANLGRTSE